MAAKAAPDSISSASSGVGGLAHVSKNLLQQQGSFPLAHAPYRGGGPALQDALSGQVPLFMSNVVIISQCMRAGTLRRRGVTSAGETPHVPGVKSFAQQGFVGFGPPTWWAFLGCAATPPATFKRMEEALRATLTNAEVRARTEEQGAAVVTSGPDQSRAFLAKEVDRWGKMIRDNNTTLDSWTARRGSARPKAGGGRLAVTVLHAECVADRVDRVGGRSYIAPTTTRSS